VTSQSPDEAGPNAKTDAYLESWHAMTHLVMEEGASWSGREKNCAFLNLGDGRFANVSAATSADYPDDARAVALIDWDNDGALDLLIKNRSAPRLRLLRNQVGAESHWIRFQLQGTGNSNRDAIGARVRMSRAGDAPWLAAVRAGDGYLSQNSRLVHFGLGTGAGACRVEVRWPDGTNESFGELAVDQLWQLVQGSGEARAVDAPVITQLASAPTSKLSASSSEERRVVLVDRLPMAAFPLPSYTEPQRTVASFAGGPVLINLWGLSCANCFRELADFRDNASRLFSAGLRIVPLSTDPSEKQAEAKKRIAQLGHGALAGPTTPKQFEALQLLFSEMLGSNAPSYLPSSLLLDSQGRVCVVYQGPVEVDQLLDDLAKIQSMKPDARFTGKLQDGRWLATRLRGFAGLAAGLRAAGHAELAKFYDELAALDARSR
jgi:peroxiredoxin